MDMLEQRIAAELRAEMARQGRSRRWVAEQTGQTPSTVARWLRGPQSPTLNELDSICRVLGMTIPALLDAVERNGGYTPAPLRMVPATSGAKCAIRDSNPEPADRTFGPIPAPRWATADVERFLCPALPVTPAAVESLRRAA